MLDDDLRTYLIARSDGHGAPRSCLLLDDDLRTYLMPGQIVTERQGPA